MVSGPYEIENVKVDSYTVYTNNIPGGAFRGFGGPQAAFAAEHNGDLESAKSYALAALELNSDLLDLNYVLVAVYARLDENELVLTYGRKYLALLKKIGRSREESFILIGTRELAHLVLYQMGIAQVNSRRLQNAIDHFRDALKYKPDFAQAYIQLVRIAKSSKQSVGYSS